MEKTKEIIKYINNLRIRGYDTYAIISNLNQMILVSEASKTPEELFNFIINDSFK